MFPGLTAQCNRHQAETGKACSEKNKSRNEVTEKTDSEVVNVAIAALT